MTGLAARIAARNFDYYLHADELNGAMQALDGVGALSDRAYSARARRRFRGRHRQALPLITPRD